jgi:Ca-activated chloride channel family protein
MLPNTANASGWQDWWRRPDQQAVNALRQGDATKAQQLAQDPAWRGAAAYRGKDYAAAAQALQQAKGADAPYNLGNALARLGRYQDALKAYDRALQLNPHNDDARANRKIVEEAMRKQQQNSSSQQPQKQPSGGQSGQQNQAGQNGQSSGQQSQSGQQQNAGQGAQDQSSQNQNGQQPSQGAQQNGSERSSTNDRSTQQNAGQASAQEEPKTSPAPASSSERAQAAKAQQALQAQMDQALAGKQAKAPPQQAHELGVVESDDPLAKLPNDVRRDLQRVPDDPGALLRRKFELEYRERMGAQPGDGD